MWMQTRRIATWIRDTAKAAFSKTMELADKLDRKIGGISYPLQQLALVYTESHIPVEGTVIEQLRASTIVRFNITSDADYDALVGALANGNGHLC
jgi:hypothetical protein